MHLIVLIALGVVVGLLAFAYLPELLHLIGVLVVLVAVGGVLLFLLAENEKSSPPATTVVDAPQPPSNVNYASLSDRVRTGPKVAFVVHGTTGTLVGAVRLSESRTNLLVSLSNRVDNAGKLWTADRVMGQLHRHLCGQQGLLAPYKTELKEVLVVVHSQQERVGEARLAVQKCIAPSEA